MPLSSGTRCLSEATAASDISGSSFLEPVAAECWPGQFTGWFCPCTRVPLMLDVRKHVGCAVQHMGDEFVPFFLQKLC